MKTIHFFAVIFLTFFLTSCWVGTKKIIDNYELGWGDPYTQRNRSLGHFLICNISCEGDIDVDDIKNLRWNEQIIIVEKNIDDEKRWVLAKARGEQLECCNGDTVIGPITKLEVDSIIKRYKYTNLEEMVFIE